MLFCSVFVVWLTIILISVSLRGLFWILSEAGYYIIPKFHRKNRVCISSFCCGTFLPQPRTLVNVHRDLMCRGSKKKKMCKKKKKAKESAFLF